MPTSLAAAAQIRNRSNRSSPSTPPHARTDSACTMAICVSSVNSPGAQPNPPPPIISPTCRRPPAPGTPGVARGRPELERRTEGVADGRADHGTERSLPACVAAHHDVLAPVPQCPTARSPRGSPRGGRGGSHRAWCARVAPRPGGGPTARASGPPHRTRYRRPRRRDRRGRGGRRCRPRRTSRSGSPVARMRVENGAFAGRSPLGRCGAASRRGCRGMIEQLGTGEQLVADVVVTDEVPPVHGELLAQVQLDVVDDAIPPPDPRDRRGRARRVPAPHEGPQGHPLLAGVEPPAQLLVVDPRQKPSLAFGERFELPGSPGRRGALPPGWRSPRRRTRDGRRAACAVHPAHAVTAFGGTRAASESRKASTSRRGAITADFCSVSGRTTSTVVHPDAERPRGRLQGVTEIVIGTALWRAAARDRDFVGVRSAG